MAAIDQVARETNDPALRVTRALRLVQDKVRYVSLSIGAGSYKPRLPSQVVRSGYGDCKDKALLLAFILRRLGIDAVPALTDSDAGRGLPEMPPSANAFDHAIVRVRHAGQTYWVDPTRSHEGGILPNIRQVRTAWALPIAPGQSALEKIPYRPPTTPGQEVVERYEWPRGEAKALNLTVTTHFRGPDADLIRARLAANSHADTEKSYLEFYSKMYPGLRTSHALRVSDDRDTNVVTIIEAYHLPASALKPDGLAAKFPITASALEDYGEPPGGVRRAPLMLTFPVEKRHRIILVTPGRRPPAPPEVTFDGAGFRLGMEVKRTGETLTIDYRLTGLGDMIQPAQIEDFRADVIDLNRSKTWDLDLTSSRGGTIGKEGAIWGIVILVAMGAGLLAAAVFGLPWGLRADDAYAATGRYYPVALGKFIAMNIVTFNGYGFFWMWKCWRWAKAHRGRPIAPFWRALFSVFWIYPLFREVNAKLGPRALPNGLGVIAAVGYLAFAVASSAASRLGAAQTVQLLFVTEFVCLIPAAIAVIRQNEDAGDVLQRNSSFTRHTAAAVVASGLYWLFVIVGLNGG